MLYRALDFEANLQNSASLWFYLLTISFINRDQELKKRTSSFRDSESDG